MGKFDGILICTDLDGTLYKNDKSISQENKDAIEYFKREGGIFTFITGRLPSYSCDAYNSINPNAPYGCTNGGGLYDGEKEKYIWALELSPGYLPLIELIDKSFTAVGIEVCTLDNTYFSKENAATEYHRSSTGLPNLVCGYREVKEPIVKVIFATDIEEEILAVERALRAHPLSAGYELIRSERRLFEILPKGVNKGLALRKLIEYLGIDPKKTVAVGDYDNDVGMLKAAGLGVAVSNACKAALDAADVITVTNEEHAIARVIYDIENKKYSL